jgi:hypothetical protein
MPSGGRRWAFRYQRNGIVKKMGLGSAKAAGLKLSEAKDRAIDALRLLAKGTDPKEQRDDEKRRAQGSRPFGEFAEEWRQTYEIGLKHKAARNKLKRIVQVICKPLQLRLDEIETEHVVAVLRKVWRARSRATRASGSRRFGRSHSAEPAAETHPADWDSRLKPIMPKQRKRGTVRGGHKARTTMIARVHAEARQPDQSARALEVTILTSPNHRGSEHVLSQVDLERSLGFGTLD